MWISLNWVQAVYVMMELMLTYLSVIDASCGGHGGAGDYLSVLGASFGGHGGAVAEDGPKG